MRRQDSDNDAYNMGHQPAQRKERTSIHTLNHYWLHNLIIDFQFDFGRTTFVQYLYTTDCVNHVSQSRNDRIVEYMYIDNCITEWRLSICWLGYGLLIYLLICMISRQRALRRNRCSVLCWHRQILTFVCQRSKRNRKRNVCIAPSSNECW